MNHRGWGVSDSRVFASFFTYLLAGLLGVVIYATQMLFTGKIQSVMGGGIHITPPFRRSVAIITILCALFILDKIISLHFTTHTNAPPSNSATKPSKQQRKQWILPAPTLHRQHQLEMEATRQTPQLKLSLPHRLPSPSPYPPPPFPSLPPPQPPSSPLTPSRLFPPPSSAAAPAAHAPPALLPPGHSHTIAPVSLSMFLLAVWRRLRRLLLLLPTQE